jgi:hypothetical protein
MSLLGDIVPEENEMLCRIHGKMDVPLAIGLGLLLLLCCAPASAQEKATGKSVAAGPASEGTGKVAHRHWTMGSDFDLLPFTLGGYSSGGFLGRDGYRASNMMASRDIPSFLAADGFRDLHTDSYSLRADRFFGGKRPTLEGPWVGAGGDYWRSSVRTEDAPATAKFHDFLLTASGGYRWKFSRHFYLDPWVGSHFLIAGQRNIPVSGKIYKPRVFNPEGSVKAGFCF